jgi:hypothetical protein
MRAASNETSRGLAHIRFKYTGYWIRVGRNDCATVERHSNQILNVTSCRLKNRRDTLKISALSHRGMYFALHCEAQIRGARL